MKIQIRNNPSTVKDAGKVRLGGESPSFGPVMARPKKKGGKGNGGRPC